MTMSKIRTDALTMLRNDGETATPGYRRKLLDQAIAAGVMRLPGMATGDARTDAQSLAYFTRQLEYVYTETENEEFPELRMANGEIIPIDTSVPEGAETFTYYVHSTTGLAEFQSAYSHGTEPQVSVKRAKVNGNVERMRNGYEWDVQDLQNAQFVGDSLDTELASAARRAHDQLLNDTGLYGREDIGLPGLLTHPNITVSDAADNGSGSTQWADKTPDQIIEDVNDLINTVEVVTFGVEKVNRVLMPRAQYLLIRSLRLGVGDGTLTVLDYLRDTYQQDGVAFEILNELGTEFSTLDKRTQQTGVADRLNNGQQDAIFAYTAGNTRKAALVVPMPFRQYPVQTKGFLFSVPCESSTGGLRMPKPLSAHRKDGV